VVLNGAAVIKPIKNYTTRMSGLRKIGYCFGMKKSRFRVISPFLLYKHGHSYRFCYIKPNKGRGIRNVWNWYPYL